MCFQLFRKRDRYKDLLLAANYCTPPETLRKLCKRSSKPLKRKLASNINLPYDCFNMLIESGDREVIHNILSNPFCPMRILLNYIEKGGRAEKLAMLKNPCLPYNVRFKLEEDIDELVAAKASLAMYLESISAPNKNEKK